MGKKRRRPQPVSVPSDGRVATLASKALALPAPEVIRFVDPDVAEKKPVAEEAQPEEPGQKAVEADMIRLKRDVTRFSMGGMDKAEREETRLAQLVRLGGKPQRQAKVQYDELKVLRKLQRQAEKEKKEVDRRLGMQVATYRPQRKKDKNKVSGFFSQLGKKAPREKKGRGGGRKKQGKRASQK